MENRWLKQLAICQNRPLWICDRIGGSSWIFHTDQISRRASVCRYWDLLKKLTNAVDSVNVSTKLLRHSTMIAIRREAWRRGYLPCLMRSCWIWDSLLRQSWVLLRGCCLDCIKLDTRLRTPSRDHYDDSPFCAMLFVMTSSLENDLSMSLLLNLIHRTLVTPLLLTPY